MSGMRLFVKSVFVGAKVFELKVESSSTVAEVNAMIAQREQICVDKIRLMKGSVQLEDTRTLADYNVQKDSTLHFTLRLRGS